MLTQDEATKLAREFITDLSNKGWILAPIIRQLPNGALIPDFGFRPVEKEPAPIKVETTNPKKK